MLKAPTSFAESQTLLLVLFNLMMLIGTTIWLYKLHLQPQWVSDHIDQCCLLCLVRLWKGSGGRLADPCLWLFCFGCYFDCSDSKSKSQKQLSHHWPDVVGAVIRCLLIVSCKNPFLRRQWDHHWQLGAMKHWTWSLSPHLTTDAAYCRINQAITCS